jgi:hypothetical protein
MTKLTNKQIQQQEQRGPYLDQAKNNNQIKRQQRNQCRRKVPLDNPAMTALFILRNQSRTKKSPKPQARPKISLSYSNFPMVKNKKIKFACQPKIEPEHLQRQNQ